MFSDIAQKANFITSKAHSADPAEIAKKFHILLWQRELDENVKGFTFVNRCAKLICVNNKVSHYAKNYIIAHELAHLVLHSKDKLLFMCKRNCFDQTELEADLLASYIIIKDNMFISLLNQGKSISEIASLYHTKKSTLRIRKALCYKV